MVTLPIKTSAIILYTVCSFDIFYAPNLSCITYTNTSNGNYSGHRNQLTIENCAWPRHFAHLLKKPEDLGTLIALNLWTLDSKTSTTLESVNFIEMENLRVVKIMNSRITQVGKNVFEHMSRLEIINLNYNGIANVSPGSFHKCKRLKELYMSGNQIKTLPEFVFSTNKMLSVLDLSYNHLEVINSTELFKNTKIKSLHLEGNRITTIYKNTFTELNSLEFLNISYNKMSFSAIPSCNGEPYLIPENYIWFGDMAVKTNSCFIDFRYNEISGLPLFGIQAACSPIHNRCKPLTLWLDGNPLSCRCAGFDLIRYFQNLWPPSVMGLVRITDVSKCSYGQNRGESLFSQINVDRIYCSLNACSNCPTECSCMLHKYTQTVLVNCTKKLLKTFPKPLPVSRDYASEFWLSHNHIRNIDIEYPHKVHVLALSHNKISELPQTFARFSNLKVLELHDNDLKILTPDHVKHIKMLNLTRLTLGDNPWNCTDCRILSMVKYLQNSSNIIMDRKTVTCFGKEGLLVAELNVDMCKSPSGYFDILLALLLSLIILMIVLLLRYKIRPKVLVNFFEKSVNDDNKVYDAFISYCHQDEEYVAKLVQTLEARKNPFKICLHARDWLPGEFIIKQMADSVNNSRATVIVLSAAYFCSKWCYSEFRIALTQMLVRRNHKVILIWLSDEDINLGTLDPDIRLYINTCTYLKYNDQRFLSKLESALS